MSVVATSVFLLFALIVLGFILGKRNIIHKESIPDFSTFSGRYAAQPKRQRGIDQSDQAAENQS